MEKTHLDHHHHHHHHHHQQHQQEIINNFFYLTTTSPASCNRDSSTANNCNNNEGAVPVQTGPAPPPLTPKAAFRSSYNNPYPTTFVQADTSNFKQVVQMLTGSTTPTDQQQQQQRPDPRATAIPLIRTAPKKQQQGFRLYERRNSLKDALMINTLGLLPGISSSRDAAAGFSPRNLFPNHRHHKEALSPSVLDFPKLALSSPVTPLNDDPFGKSSSSSSSSEEERAAIAEKGFYFHTNTPRDTEPRLLPLFPLTSPRASGAPS